MWRLLGPDGRFYDSPRPGTLGGHRLSRIYGRLDCRTARAALSRGGPYPAQRVFFADEAAAVAAGYRPCAVCLPAAYRRWKNDTTAATRRIDETDRQPAHRYGEGVCRGGAKRTGRT